MCSNNMEYIIVTGPYCITHDVKMTFFMPYFSISKIISHQFHVDKNEDESGIGCVIIIGRDMMVQLGLFTTISINYFNGMVLQY